LKDHIKFILKNSIIFAIISFGFSMIGGLFPSSEHTFVIGNPLVVSSVTYEHVIGHIFWGAVIGLGTLSIRYIVLGGSFAILLDADHLLQFLDIELVVVNNGSNDHTLEILEGINDKRLKVISVAPDPRNTFASGIEKALKASIGKYVAVQDSDDISEVNRIEKQWEYLEAHQDVGLIGSKFYVIGQFGEALGTSIELPESEELMQKYAEGNFLAHSSVMFRREIAVKLGGYNQKYAYACDYRLALDILNAGYKIAAINQPLIKSRRHVDQETVKKGSEIIRNQNLLALLQHAQGLNFLNKKSILKGRRQITKAKFQGVLNSLMKDDYFSAFKLFIDAALEAPIYIMVYAFVRTVRGQLKDTPRPQETDGNNRLGFK